MNYFKKASLIAVAVSAVVASAQPAFAQGGESAELEEVVVMGSRSNKPRSATDSTVPVDVFSEAELSAFGNQADITDTLKALVPSYTATPATGDGSAFIRPTSLRGMAPDQALVLVNGKRRHRSALVQFFAPAAGNGAHGVDVAMIPGIALKNIEVLRDGAAAQYGSDAIAGVMNLQLKDSAEGGSLQVQHGEFFEGEQSTRVAANGGFALGDDGFLNVSFESVDNDALSRGIQRPVGQGLIDAGVPNVGADSPFGDAPFVQTWGRPETSGDRLFFNAGVTDPNTGVEVYAHGGYAETDGRYRFFYRAGYDQDCSTAHGTIQSLCQDANWVPGTLRQGYTPYLDGAQTDISLVGGIRGDMGNGYSYDISMGRGSNELRYILNNTTAPSLGVASDGSFQRDFIMGGYDQEEVNFNADFNKTLSADMNLAFGAEWREETFTTVPGEQSAIDGNTSGMSSVKPADAGSFSRDNVALYVDLEHDVSDDLLMQYAVRYEDFSDFGNTANGKIAGRYTVNDTLTLRGSMSTGFHAPTPGQANVSTVITTFDGTTGLQVEEGLVRPTSEAALAVGGAPLKEEESFNISLGLTTELGDNTTLTFDMYHVAVDDRIYRTGDIPNGSGGSVSFYTNALDVEHQGFDLVLSSSFELMAGMDTTASLAFNHNTIEVTGQKTINGVAPVRDSLVEDIENNYPENRWVLNTLTNINDKMSLMARLNFYGEHYDERGTIGAESDPSALIDSIVYLDIELGYDVTDNLRLTAGGSNILDEYVDEIDAPYANRMSVGLPYPRRTAANYEGGSWYLRANYSF
ncbi:MAG: TonB-dependent receptor [Porticoccaceae bacterium]|jgi:iron complex outermembrane receptor protein|nr:TonB-dependent receptor [Porticoccaceae bacterium]MBT5578536.1 TonB-dependent receptor [Porticoccaceae bacterium]MBT7375365.1 TonB-dependent receptor [Porticoccaceae bacterium]